MSSMSSRTCSWWAHRTEWPHGCGCSRHTVMTGWQGPLSSDVDLFFRRFLKVALWGAECSIIRTTLHIFEVQFSIDRVRPWLLRFDAHWNSIDSIFSCILAMLNLTTWKLSQSASNASFSHHFPGKAPQIWFCGAHLASCTCDFFVQCLCHDSSSQLCCRVPEMWKPHKSIKSSPQHFLEI